MYAAVVVNQKARALDRIFHYEIPADLPVELGMLVEVSFAGRRLEAVVVDIMSETEIDPAKIKPIERVCEPRPLFHPDLLAVIPVHYKTLAHDPGYTGHECCPYHAQGSPQQKPGSDHIPDRNSKINK